jgi:multidrug resistance efflux pump
MNGIFRREAIEAHASERTEGDVLRFDSTWTTWSVRVVIGAALCTLLYVVLFDVSEYASGFAIVRVEGRRPLITAFAGTVEAVHVQPGQHVEKDQILVTLTTVHEEAELRRASAEFELNLAALLRDPADHSAKQMLSSLKPRRDLARQLARARFVRAPHAGVVTDVRIRAGQHLGANELVLGIAPLDAPATLVCALPGEYRPMLKVGQDVRFALDGYKFEYRTVTVDGVGEEVVGPMEMRRYLGQELADVFPLHGPTVLVKAKLPSRTFEADGQTYTYVEGLTGHADVRVRSEPILLTLLPALKALRPES